MKATFGKVIWKESSTMHKVGLPFYQTGNLTLDGLVVKYKSPRLYFGWLDSQVNYYQ